MSHDCPGPGEVHSQGGIVPDDMLACSRHWYQVSRPTQARVYRAWANGAGRGTLDHYRAMEAAIAQMTPLPPPRSRAS